MKLEWRFVGFGQPRPPGGAGRGRTGWELSPVSDTAPAAPGEARAPERATPSASAAATATAARVEVERIAMC